MGFTAPTLQQRQIPANWAPWALSAVIHGLLVAILVVSGIFRRPEIEKRGLPPSTVFVELEPDESPIRTEEASPERDRHLLVPLAALHQPPPSSLSPVSGRQIVDLPAATGEEPDQPTPYVSEQASRAIREQKGKYGSPQNAGTPAPDPEAGNRTLQPTEEPRPAEPPASETAGIPRPPVIPESDLFPGPEERQGEAVVAMAQQRKSPALPAPVNPPPGTAGNCPNPPCTQVVITGEAGTTTDFLAGIEATGDITLLNAKSVTHAGFVRRVATNVFNYFIRSYRSRGWRVNPNDLDDALRVDAILTAAGEQELVFIRQSSGTRQWDDMGLDAMKRGAWDSNPPKGALASDGKIHFVFVVDHRRGILMAGIL